MAGEAAAPTNRRTAKTWGDPGTGHDDIADAETKSVDRDGGLTGASAAPRGEATSPILKQPQMTLRTEFTDVSTCQPPAGYIGGKRRLAARLVEQLPGS
jgi:hypothetical protein